MYEVVVVVWSDNGSGDGYANNDSGGELWWDSTNFDDLDAVVTDPVAGSHFSVHMINCTIQSSVAKGHDASEQIRKTEVYKKLIVEKESEVQQIQAALQLKLIIIGNLVHDSVPISNDEANNSIIRTWGQKRMEPTLKNHVELVELLGIADTKKDMLDIHRASVKKQVHMGDTLGIFRVHQFEKVEQFCITCPNGNELWDMHEQMMRNSEVFYKMVEVGTPSSMEVSAIATACIWFRFG
ncbi:hypothetical protein RHGRI_004825 [Rhododendron griersonianum]|uniref:Uncharacterized protein n=1 Tax=Rhododendron griersonianum TaxID=479676 RepID=A0AAV6LA22_9ERIC|nr:hypothetical protein RHGRI_004825 [Rhododendron griersonianum]